MSDDPKRLSDASVAPEQLNYFIQSSPRPSRRRALVAKLFFVSSDQNCRQWWFRRWLYYLGLFGLFSVIAFYFGPNEINFGKLRRLNAADFVPVVERDCAPVVRAMKEFERDHGRLPNDESELKTYLPQVPFDVHIMNGTMDCYTQWNHNISYDFAPGHECWRIYGPLVNGLISAQPVTIGPATQPAR